MRPFEDLLTRLDAASPADWEVEYASAQVAATFDDVAVVFGSDRPYAEWLGFRFDAGPPGIPLPTTEDAVRAVLNGAGATPLDTYQAVFASPPLTEDVPRELIMALLVNAATAALARGRTWMATWLGARAGLACIALGAPEHAWRMLDLHTTQRGRHPHLDKLAYFEPLRHDEVANRSPWIRAAICRLWPKLEVPVLPELPWPDLPTNRSGAGDVLETLERLEAPVVRGMVQNLLADLDTAMLESHREEPLVNDLLGAAMRGDRLPPSVDALPAWFAEWTTALSRSGAATAARLAGLLLAEKDPEKLGLAATLVFPVAQASDLELLMAGFDAPELTKHFEELRVVSGQLPTQVADALVACGLPHHRNRLAGLGVLADNIDLLQGLKAAPGGVVEWVVTDITRALEEQRRETAAAAPLLDQLCLQIEEAVGRLEGVGQTLTAVSIDNVLSQLPLPTAIPGLLDGVEARARELSRVGRLLLVLAAKRVAADSEGFAGWCGPLAKAASDAIRDMHERSLFELRLELLDEAISAEYVGAPMGLLHFERANMRQGTQHQNAEATRQAAMDLHAAMALAEAGADAALFARAASAWAKLAAWSADGRVQGTHDWLRAAREGLTKALTLPIDDFDRATVLQAQAHIVRLDDLTHAAALTAQARALVDATAPFWAELAAEEVATLNRAKQTGTAVERGAELLDAYQGPGDRPELGMLHLAIGEAAHSAGKMKLARQRVEAGMRLLTGRDTLNEALGRLRLVHLGIATGELDLADEQLRFLNDHRDELDPVMIRDVERTAADVHGARGNASEQRNGLLGVRAATTDRLARLRLDLEIAHLDQSSGRQVPALERLLLAACAADLDPQHQDLLMQLAANSTAPLVGECLEAVLVWARERRRPSMVARLLHQSDRLDEARQELNTALAELPDGEERLRCVHQLLPLAVNGPRDELLRICDELERLLDTVSDADHVRLDLAEALRNAGRDGGAVLQGAKLHALRGLGEAKDPRVVAHGQGVMARISIGLLRTSVPLSSAEVGETAAWLLQADALPPETLAQAQVEAVGLLLAPGPLTHPAALEVAEKLLASCERDYKGDGLDVLQRRLAWAQRCASEACVVEAAPAERLGGFDTLPRWAVDLTHGKRKSIAPAELAADLGALASVAQARPDRVDSMLAAVVHVQHKLSDGLREEALRFAYAAAQEAAQHNAGKWPELRAALQKVPRKRRHRGLTNLESVVQRVSTGTTEQARHSEGRATELRPAAPTRRHVGSKGPAYARQCYEEGVSSMELAGVDPLAPTAAARIGEARKLLGQAVMIARTKRMPELFSFTVSCGNAWRTAPGEDIERALKLYAAAAALAQDSDQRAQLWKVKADALRTRGTDQDLRNADKLLQRACDIRRGRYLAETLMSRAQVAAKHPDFDESERARMAVKHAMAAVRTDTHFGDQDGVIEFLKRQLADWERNGAGSDEIGTTRTALKRLYPGRSRQIDAPVLTPSNERIDQVLSLLGDPALKVFQSVRSRLDPQVLAGEDTYGLLSRFGPDARRRAKEAAEQETLIGRPDQMARLLGELETTEGDPARAGVLAARALLTAALAREGRGSKTEVRTATELARAAVEGMSNERARTLLFHELASLWCPTDHIQDPVNDFAYAVQILQQCVELEGGEEAASADSLGYLARAYRYSRSGSPRDNLLEAQRLYEKCFVLCRKQGSTEMEATVLANLAEVKSQLGGGSRLARLREGLAQLEAAVKAAANSVQRALLTASLAWQHVQIGQLLDGPASINAFEAALATFDEVDLSKLEPSTARNVVGNRAVAEASLARRTLGRAAELQVYRARLESLDPESEPYRVATTQHNLGSTLMASVTATTAEMAEGLRLLELAAKVRTLKVNARHHWETALAIGGALTTALAVDGYKRIPMRPLRAAPVARKWLLRAAKAARVLGRGEELADVGRMLCRLATCLGPTMLFSSCADEGWGMIAETSGYVLLDGGARESEATLAGRLAFELALRLASKARKVQYPRVDYVLRGRAAQDVETWFIRAQTPTRRPLQARLSRPAGVSTAVWDAWLDALANKDQSAVADALDTVRAKAPGFLAEDGANDATWQWLSARPGSVAIAVMLSDVRALVLVMRVDPKNRRQRWVLGLTPGEAPRQLEELALQLSRSVPDAETFEAHQQAARWVREAISGPIEALLGDVPKAILWCPGPGLRGIAPRSVWPNSPVAMATSLVLPDLSAAPRRRASTMLVLADPGNDVEGGALDLGRYGLESVEALRDAAAALGPVRLIGSRGARYGRELLGDASQVRNTPASASDVLEEARNHEVLVIVAHGRVESPTEAALLCVDGNGQLSPLNVAALSEKPEQIEGAAVVLLACASGQIGDALADPGGLAGTLIAAGARCVVAPLWPVRLDIAKSVGVRVVEGLGRGQAPWEVLASVETQTAGDAPVMGAPPPTMAEEQQSTELQELSFVAWVG